MYISMQEFDNLQKRLTGRVAMELRKERPRGVKKFPNNTRARPT